MKNLHVLSVFGNVCIGLCMLFAPANAAGQAIPNDRITDWSAVGLQDTVPSYTNIINIMSHGGVNNGSASNNTAFTAAVSALGGNAGVVYFPAGNYFFDQSLSLPDSVVIRGAGKDSTKLLFDLGGSFQNLINIQGNIGTTVWNVTQSATRNDSVLTLNTTAGLSVGDWVMLYDDDSSFVTSPWAYETTGQIFQIENISGNIIAANHLLRRNYPVNSTPRLKRIIPVTGAGIECLYIERQDSTAQQTTNINMNYAANCWVIGVESNKTNFAHIGLNSSAHILVRGNYIHHSHGYGGGGRGYGVVLQYTTGDCLVDNNIFEFLRHAMLLQIGANGNVLSYNYSKDPNWVEPSLPANSAGDAVLHGDYPYLNLFEGNIVQHIVIDNSHGMNGPYNTFFRNRAQLYGIFMNNGAGATDSVNFAGNEVTNTSPLMGNFSLAGTGHLQQGNTIKGILTPAGSTVQEPSLYLNGPPSFWQGALPWPHVGTPYPYNNYNNTAQARYAAGTPTDCRVNPVYVSVRNIASAGRFNLYPNPSNRLVTFELSDGTEAVIYVYDLMGRSIAQLGLSEKGMTTWDASPVGPGIYLYAVQVEGVIVHAGKIVITE